MDRLPVVLHKVLGEKKPCRVYEKPCQPCHPCQVNKPVFEAKIYTEKIQNFNCHDMCCEKTCSQPYTQFAKFSLNGLELFLKLCKKHAFELEERGWKKGVAGVVG